MSKYSQSIFIFRADLRLHDNLGLIQALKESSQVIPIFILTPEQLTNNPYKSNNAIQFMVESLNDLNLQLENRHARLHIFYGKPFKVIAKILKHHKNINAIFVNEDYSPYSKRRDREIHNVCKSYNIAFISCHDSLLNPVGSIITSTGHVYTKFTPYFNTAKQNVVPKPKKNTWSNYGKKDLDGEYSYPLSKFYKKNTRLLRKGGRSEALKILRRIEAHKSYNKTRNDPNIPTTQLSAYIKFGCVSIREVYHIFKFKLGTSDLIKQLYWREFYRNILYAYPHVVGHAMKEKYNNIKWSYNKTHFKAWCMGLTGYPIVDAGMRQMNTTGWMHNRLRLIVSNFLVKILGIDWRWGEKYFSRTLIDSDLANNNGNWQWIASTGADSQPYFRIFNPWLQSKKYDADATFIRTWIPELKHIPTKRLHRWDLYHKEYMVEYPEPIVSYEEGRNQTLLRYKIHV